MPTFETDTDTRMLNDCVLTATNCGSLYPTFCEMARANSSLIAWNNYFDAVVMPTIAQAGCRCRYGLRDKVAEALRDYYVRHVNEA